MREKLESNFSEDLDNPEISETSEPSETPKKRADPTYPLKDLAEAKEDLHFEELAFFEHIRKSMDAPEYELTEEYKNADTKLREAKKRYRAIEAQVKPKKKSRHKKASKQKEFSLQDLARARSDLSGWQAQFGSSSGNNPNKYRSQIKNAANEVRAIERALKDSGKLKLTKNEEFQKVLDEKFPNAKSKTIIAHAGKRYQIHYFPIDISRSGKTVKEWGHEWRLVKE